jgi:uncharacterized protein (DUF1499 family)
MNEYVRVFFKQTGFVVLAFLVIAAVFTGIEYFGGQPMGIFSGSRPEKMGFSSGKFAACSWKPNCVCSTSDPADEHYIAPLKLSDDVGATWKKLSTIVTTNPAAKLVRYDGGYMYVEYKSKGLGFIDDVEFALDAKAGVIHVRSASRLGIRDFGVNRTRIEEIRAKLAA